MHDNLSEKVIKKIGQIPGQHLKYVYIWPKTGGICKNQLINMYGDHLSNSSGCCSSYL